MATTLRIQLLAARAACEFAANAVIEAAADRDAALQALVALKLENSELRKQLVVQHAPQGMPKISESSVPVRRAGYSPTPDEIEKRAAMALAKSLSIQHQRSYRVVRGTSGHWEVA